MTEFIGNEFDSIVAPLTERYTIHELPKVDGDSDRIFSTLLNNGLSSEEIQYMLGFEESDYEV